MTGWSPGSGEGDAGREGTRFSATALLTLGAHCAVCGEDGEWHPWPRLPKTRNQKRLQALPNLPWQVNWSLVEDYGIRELFRA